ncbi:MinD/ParA family protein [Cellulomonas sp. P22]|uniref:MinD/ParA family protein n=1 Tax=Cellulomonas sp. P22 TaxID=3373189 RepID=UPI00378CBAB5
MSEPGSVAQDVHPSEAVQAVVRADGTGEIVIEGIVQRVATGSMSEAGAAVTGLIAELAGRAGRPLAAEVEDPDGLWSLVIHPDGRVEEAIPGADPEPSTELDDETRTIPVVPDAAPSPRLRSTRTTRRPAAAPDDDAATLPTLDDLLATRSQSPHGPAEHGWRGGVRRATLGLVTLRPGRDEHRHRDAVRAVQRSLDGPKTIVVINPKGGAHKTTATLLLASTFGIHRGGYTLAWDNNETRGTLGWRSEHARHTNTAVNLLQNLSRFTDLQVARVGDLDNYVRSQGSSQFDVLASDEDAASAASVDAAAFSELHRTLERFYRVMVIDTGNNMRASNWQAAIDVADQLVLVSTVREDTAQSAAWAIDALRATGHQDLVRQAVTVLSAPESRVDRRLRRRLHEHFGALTRTVVDVPHDRGLVSGGPIGYDALSRRTREAWLQVTAEVADGL